jgi:hypothetical protein
LIAWLVICPADNGIRLPGKEGTSGELMAVLLKKSTAFSNPRIYF